MKRFTYLKHIKARDIAWYSIFILVLLCIRSSVFASYRVPTGSMNPTILEGEFFFANKLAYRLKVPFSKVTLIDWNMPSRGDIVVFKFPGDETEMYTKRVIGVPGDVVEIVDKRVYVNGTAIEERLVGRRGGTLVYEEDLTGVRHLVHHTPSRTPLDTVRRVTVPDGHFFVMGDNRDSSYDSRAWGPVPFENIEGKMAVCWLSLDPRTHLPRFDRIGLIR
jgi:signal peptidase I